VRPALPGAPCRRADPPSRRRRSRLPRRAPWRRAIPRPVLTKEREKGGDALRKCCSEFARGERDDARKKKRRSLLLEEEARCCSRMECACDHARRRCVLHGTKHASTHPELDLGLVQPLLLVHRGGHARAPLRRVAFGVSVSSSGKTCHFYYCDVRVIGLSVSRRETWNTRLSGSQGETMLVDSHWAMVRCPASRAACCLRRVRNSEVKSLFGFGGQTLLRCFDTINQTEHRHNAREWKGTKRARYPAHIYER
jgi:hypothetical protein